MLGIGDRLKSAREARGLSLDDVEAVTRIRRRYLEALEEEAFDRLPGSAYVRGFLKSYASYLGLPADEVASMCPPLHAAPITVRASPSDVRITPVTRRSRARRLVIGASFMLVCGAVAIAYIFYSQVRQFVETREPSLQSGAPASSPAAPPSPSPPFSGGAIQPPSTGAAPPSPAGSAGESATANPSQVPVAEAQAAPPGAGPVTVAAVATDRSWVRAVADGVTVFEGFLSAGDQQVWQAKRQLTLRIGNASAISLTVNGRPVGRLGNPGDVVDETYTGSAP